MAQAAVIDVQVYDKVEKDFMSVGNITVLNDGTVTCNGEANCVKYMSDRFELRQQEEKTEE